jgi:hypothetical protein
VRTAHIPRRGHDVGPAAEAELAARALAARDEFEAKQGELFEMFRAKHDGAGKGNGGAAP